MRIDVHTHYLPEQFVDLLLDMDTPVGLETDGDRLYMRHQFSGTASVASGNRIPVNEGFIDLDARLAWMDAHNIDRTLVSVSTPNPLASAFTTDQSTRLIHAINDGFADAAAASSDRLTGLGMLPLRDPEAARAEVDRIVSTSGLCGVALPTALPDGKLSAPELKPVFDAIDDHDLTAFVHPHGNRLSEMLDETESFLNPLVVFPTDTTLQVARLIYDGFFDDHDFDVVLAHMGGALLHLAGRLDRGRREIDDPAARPDRPIIEYLQEFYYDTISFHRPAFTAAVETVGIDHFVFGTDYPFDEEDIDTALADISAVVSAEGDRERVMGTTATDLFDL
ncbi:2-hydroxy-3-carboxy-6-oxo-7-methylocta-2,4-dienoa te decarboxylase [Haloarcula mannanilytica]|uniref:2-hydroxy-3-carboxy-6-oxo-7-methylocta-2,4-dienoa te decarboxylase n=1 Tax=Haloarcula mannanilytica TaxID=2509225 RepID=A0A4C2EQE8_9EURY|nr:amidohydrolase family protein [Haloarcula mannanilytica]GCF14399.1 2-hydroxy-3-carboxy-6-oxo-7-methylocta-2,4-dienoa te decarboxylase [Haloarcula mannanilytica]